MGKITEVVKNLLIINGIIFLITQFFSNEFAQLLGIIDSPCFQNSGATTAMQSYFSIHYFDSACFRPFQLVTNIFSHGSMMHILFNMMSLFFIGPMLEMTLGAKRFLNLYMIAGIGGMLFYVLEQAAIMYLYTGTLDIPPYDLEALDQMRRTVFGAVTFNGALGASGAISGLLVALGIMNPDLKLYVMFIPVPIKAKYLAIFGVVFSLVIGIIGFPGSIGGIAHFAHLGGMVFAYFYFVKEYGWKPW